MMHTPTKSNRKPLVEIRTTVNTEPDVYASLAEIAHDRRVSIGWVARDAVANKSKNGHGRG
jgi:hypothetical protein